MSLVEVMMASSILTIVGASLVSGFIQNARFARAVAMRTAAITTAIGVAEQLRSFSYADYSTRHFDPTNKSLPIQIFDPTDTADVGGMRTIETWINVADGNPVSGHETCTYATVPFVIADSGTTTRIAVPMRFWIESRNRVPRTVLDPEGVAQIVDRCQVFEIALVYQWQNPNMPSSTWNSGVIRIVTPNTDMNTFDPT